MTTCVMGVVLQICMPFNRRLGFFQSLFHAKSRKNQSSLLQFPFFSSRPDKNRKNGPICSILHYLKKIFPGGMPPDPPNLLIYTVFLALAAAGPLQCERLEPPVVELVFKLNMSSKQRPSVQFE